MKCSHCYKFFAKLWKLNRHKITHRGEKPYGCSKCDRSFRESASLRKYVLIHTGDKPFLCTQCGKSFYQSSHLKGHTNYHHRGLKYNMPAMMQKKTSFISEFVCKWCDKVYPTRNALNLHKVTHIEEKPLKCTNCGNIFQFASKLSEHERTHTGYKPLECSYCYKSIFLIEQS